MKRLTLFFFLCQFSLQLASFGQTANEGIVEFTTITTDTVNDVTVTLPDSIRHRYYFKGNNYRTLYGTDSVNNSIIVNGQGTYVLSVVYGDKRYTHDSVPGNIGLDSLMNYWDTSSIGYLLTNQHKTILGYTCTLGYFFYLSQNGESGVNDTTQVVAFWYTDQIQGNNLIPGAGQTTLNLNGLIMEYDTPVPNGLQTVTCQSLLLQAVDESVFYPNLSGYINSNSGGN